MPDAPGKERILGWSLLGAAMVASTALLFWLQRDLAFADDGFNWLSLTAFGSGETLVEPYGGHLIFVPLLIFKTVLAVAGTSYTAFGVVQMVLMLLLSGLVYEYGRRRVGPLLALPAAVILLFLGSSWNFLLQPMLGIQFLCALVPGVAALLALERDDRAGDIACCALLVLASWGFEMGFAFLAGATVSIGLRRDRWRRIWIVAIPLVVYGAWKLWATKFGGGSELHLSNLLWAPAYMVDSFGVDSVSLFGLYQWVGHAQLTNLKLNGFNANNFSEGIVILVFGGIAVGLAVRRLLRLGPLRPSFWVALAVLLTLWLEQALALSPDRTPGEIRYIFPGTVVLLLFVLEAARGVRTSRWALAIAAALLVAGLVGNAARLKEGRELLATYSSDANAAMGVMVLAGDEISPEFNPALNAPEAFQPGLATIVGAGTVQMLSEKYSRLGFSAAELAQQSESVRRSADIVAAHALEVHTVPADGATCQPDPGGDEEMALPPGGAILVSERPADLLARRFADEFVIGVGEVRPGEAMALTIPADAADTPWRVQAPGGGSLTVCPFEASS